MVLTVGSGNPTLSGWGYNRELWVTTRSSRQFGRQLVTDVADWLHELPDVMTIASWIAATLRQVADRIRPATLDERSSSMRAYGNPRRPQLEQLPTDPVGELRLAVLFYDPPARAVTALVERAKPRSVRIAVQPSIAVFDGAALVRATGSTVGTTVGMTGSANITASALLMSTVQGGNGEPAFVTPHTDPLFPEGDPHPGAAFRQMASAPSAATEPSGPAPVLLGCALTNGTLLVEPATPATQRVIIETSPSAVPGTSDNGRPNSWYQS